MLQLKSIQKNSVVQPQLAQTCLSIPLKFVYLILEDYLTPRMMAKETLKSKSETYFFLKHKVISMFFQQHLREQITSNRGTVGFFSHKVFVWQ